MLEIDHTLLSKEALDNLIVEIITRQATDYGEYEIDIHVKKNQLRAKILSGDAIIVYSSKEEACDIIRLEDFQKIRTALAFD